MKNNSLTPDREQAERFLTLLDEEAEGFTFQTFDDDADRKDRSLALILHGTLEKYWDRLVELNRRGAGVFVTINATDGEGRKRGNITRVRALFQEADRGDEPALPCEAHIEVESSPGKHHRYVRVEDMPLDAFNGHQQRLVEDYGSDPNAADVARVLRLPGFYHQKVNRKKEQTGEPHMVRIVSESAEQPLSYSQVEALFPPSTRKRVSGFRPGNVLQKGQFLNPAEVASALLFIDPDVDYSTWITILAAIHYASGGGQDGLDLADEWSSYGGLYRPGEVAYRWGTFSHVGDQLATLGTIFHLAYEGGWTGEYVEDDLVIERVDHERARTLKHFGDRHALVLVEGKAMVAYRELDNSTDYMTTRLAPTESINKQLANKRLPFLDEVKGKTAIVERPLFQTWMKSAGRVDFQQITYLPIRGLIAGDLDLKQLSRQSPALNLYQGLAQEPVQGDCDAILTHIREVWCSGNLEHYEYVLSWLACIFQCPAQQGHTVIVLRSGEGTGKNIIIDILGRALGNHACVVTNPKHITGQFNDHLATSSLVFLNEAIWGGDKSQEGALKSLVTDSTLAVERKYIPRFEVRNYTHVVIASNNDWVVPVGMDDRRFFMLDVSDHRKGDLPYFKQLADSIENGGAAAFVYHLLHEVDLTGFDPRKMPRQTSTTRIDNKLRTADSITQWWAQCLTDGEIQTEFDHCLVARGDYSNPGEWHEEEIRMLTRQVQSSYADWCSRHKRHPETETSLGHKLRALTGGRIQRKRETTEKRRPFYTLPPLAECRAAFSKHMGGDSPWELLDDT